MPAVRMLSAFSQTTAAFGRAYDLPALSGVDPDLGREMIALAERDPRFVADQVRAWLEAGDDE
jgi:hypothetical protein